MRRTLLALAPLLFLAACQDKSLSEPAPIVAPESSAGGVAFRLAEAERVVLSQTSDSLRVEAWRDGRVVSASGKLDRGVLVERLAEGAWTFKVAAYDRSGSIQWAGEGQAKVVAGQTIDLVVVLRRATGSVHVRITLDSGDVDPGYPGIPGDTLWNPMDSSGVLTSPVPQTLVGVERMGAYYIAIRTPFNCNAPRPALVRVARPDGVVRLVLVNRGPMTKMMCTEEYRELVLVYKPWTAAEQIVVEDLQGHVLRVPPVYPDPEDPNNGDREFVAFSFQQGGGFTIDGASYSVNLMATGKLLVSRLWAPRCEAEACPAVMLQRVDSALLSSAAMDSVRRVLADSGVAWPIQLAEPELSCADAPWWSAKIAYGDGHVAYFDKPEPICSGLPASYEKVSSLAWSLIQRLGLI